MTIFSIRFVLKVRVLDMNTSETSPFEKKLLDRTYQFVSLFSLLVGISAIILSYWWFKHRQHRLKHHGTSLLLCGISNSGKTQLFNRLTSSPDEDITHSSKIHHGIMTLDYLSTDRPIIKVHVIDLPGNFRRADLHAYRTTVKGIIFVIDSTSIDKDIEQVSDYLYEILCEEDFRQRHLPLLIFCNKQDLDRQYHDLQTVYQLLEDQLTIKRQKLSAFNRKDQPIGQLGKENFQFEDIKDIRIEFVEGSVLDIGISSKDQPIDNSHDNRSHLLRVHQWIARIWFK